MSYRSRHTPTDSCRPRTCRRCSNRRYRVSSRCTRRYMRRPNTSV
jgi:hypothetical protein